MKNHKIGKIIIANILTFVLTAGPIFADVQTPTTPVSPMQPQAVQVVPQTPATPIAPTAPTSPSNANSDKSSTSASVNPQVSSVAASDSTAATEQAAGTQAGPIVAGSTLTNSTTGADSINSTSLHGAANSTNLTTTNTAHVLNNIFGNASSGGNQSSYNTGNGRVKSGNANAMLSLINLVNTSLVALPGGQFSVLFSQVAGNLLGNYIVDNNTGEVYDMNGSRVSVVNNNTGANSENTAYVNTGSKTSIDNINDAIVGNNISLIANTGNNSASYNTGDGSVATGNANVSLNLLNFVNSSLVAGSMGLLGVMNVFGSWLGNLVLPDSLTGGLGNLSLLVGNQNTGAGSTNAASVSGGNILSIANDNLANLVNTLKVATNTGDNTSSFNTGNGSVTTGSAKSEVNVENVANQNIIGDTAIMLVINVMGSWNGTQMYQPIIIASNNLMPMLQTLLASNSDTGAGSANAATVTGGSKTDITNINTANISNNLNLSANTGGNQSSYNTGSGSVSTGNASVLANVLNFANLNIVASKLVVMVMNVFGDWNGTLTNVNTTQTQTSVSTAVASAHAASAIGNIVVSQEPITGNFSIHFDPADSAIASNSVSNSIQSHNNSGSALASDSNTGSGSGLAQTANFWQYLFGTLLGLYAIAIGISIYRKRIIEARDGRLALMNFTRRAL